MDSIYLRWWGCGAFDILMGDINIAIDPYLFDENLERAEPIYDYIFITHEHFDHCHPETLRRLCTGDRFKTLFVPIGCLTPNEPIKDNYGDAAFERDLPIIKHVPKDKVQVVFPKYLTDASRSFPGPFEFTMGPLHVEAFESGENARPDLPTCGYLITHTGKDVSFFHTGDLHKTYVGLEKAGGRVDFLIHMKTGLKSWHVFADLLNAVHPRFLIPTHYRTDRKSDPIPEGHWPPDVTDPNAFIEDIRAHAGKDVRVLPFTAGVKYEVEMPSKRVKWEWEWQKTWTVPPWRDSE